MITAILDLTQPVEILSVEDNFAFVLDQDGGEFEVCLDRLDSIERVELDLVPLEEN